MKRQTRRITDCMDCWKRGWCFLFFEQVAEWNASWYLAVQRLYRQAPSGVALKQRMRWARFAAGVSANYHDL